MDWVKLMSSERRSTSNRNQELKNKIDDHRTPFEKDYDRVVFSGPVRRLKDKTQVFPLDMHDGVRTRLTHSMEVANLARSMGVAVATKVRAISEISDAERNIPSLLAATSLTHDLGNPPFGHQGEEAIRTWVKQNKAIIEKEAGGDFDQDLLRDFLMFEGNAQGFRILTRLQQIDHDAGLNLTAATLRAYMKYPWSSRSVDKEKGIKKFGYFKSESKIFEWASESVGLNSNERHPLSYLMEVCDDIAYSVLDIEDAVRKELIAAAEVVTYLGDVQEKSSDERIQDLIDIYKSDRKWLAEESLSTQELRDAQIEIMRSYAIGILVSDAITFFIEKLNANELVDIKKGIAENFKSARLIEALKDFAYKRVFQHCSVVRSELEGHKAIPAIMTTFYNSIIAVRKGVATKMDKYVYSLISSNYVRVRDRSTDLPEWYRDVQLVCDQVCGMTDSYALRIYNDFQELGAT